MRQNDLLGSLFQWAKDVGKWWYAVLGAGLTALALYELVPAVRHHWQLALIVVLVSLLIGSFWAYHKILGRQVPPLEPPQDAARRLLTASAERGRQIAVMSPEALRNGWLYDHDYVPWANETENLLRQMFGSQMALEFATAADGIPVFDPLGWAAAQANQLEEWVKLDQLPLLGDWHPS